MNPNLKLFRNSIFHHLDIENGAPTLYSYAAFGGKERVFLKRIADILVFKYSENIETLKILANYYIDYCKALPNLIANIKIPNGVYKVPDVQKSIHFYLDNFSQEIAAQNIEELSQIHFQKEACMVEFNLTEHHKKMLNHIVWNIDYNWNKLFRIEEIDANRSFLVEQILTLHNHNTAEKRYNVPIISADPKIPYGNRTYYYWDLEDIEPLFIAKGELNTEHKRKLFTNDQISNIDQLQYELSLTLQAMVMYENANANKRH